MPVGVVTGFTHNDREYDVPTTTDQRKRFTRELKRELTALDGVTATYNAGATRTWDSVRLEVELTTVERNGRDRLDPNPRSISPRLRNALSEFRPVSTYDVLYTPEPVDADADLYDSHLYIVEVWFY